MSTIEQELSRHHGYAVGGKSVNQFTVWVLIAFVAIVVGGAWLAYTEAKARDLAANWSKDPASLEQVASVNVLKDSCDLKMPYVASRALSIFSAANSTALARYEEKVRKDLLGNPIAFALTQSLACPLLQKAIDVAVKSQSKGWW
jgi:hypothetical protein